MSRSFKHTPILGNTTAKSDKAGKQAYNRRYRNACKRLLSKGAEIPSIKEFSNPYDLPKDGKAYSQEAVANKRLLRK